MLRKLDLGIYYSFKLWHLLLLNITLCRLVQKLFDSNP
uniref:Uncharacterized protein n=1 Tax=Arundo donax TaxID=35708 RepID=A0A0A9H7B9_ARUDO